MLGLEVGQVCLMLALSTCIYLVVICLVGLRHRIPSLFTSAEIGVYLTFLLVTGAMGVLWYYLGTSRFEVAYVAKVSNRDLPFFYKFAALWAGQAGSLLLWTWVLSIYTLAAVYTGARKHPIYMPYLVLVCSGTMAFFLIVNLFAANPFLQLMQTTPAGELLSFVPRDGRGLNPLLQHPAMTIHPPVLYLGYIGFVIPFGYAIGALATRRIGPEWSRIIRRWTLVPWFFLGTGIILGGWWAYEELGWGGYWAWDPVENASIMPWFTATAFLHSIMVQERRGMLKGWNFVLIISTYLLCIFGTFLTRSGVVSSVHAFAKSSIGTYFLVFLILSSLASFALLLSRWNYLKGERQFEAVLSKESGFLYNNLLFLAACLAVFFGTLYPVFTEWMPGEKASVGAEFFNTVFIPIGLLLLFLMGAAPLLSWGATSFSNLKRLFIPPLIGALVAIGICLALDIQQPAVLVAFALAAFAIVGALGEFYRGVQARKQRFGESLPVALNSLFQRHQRRYGGYLVHLGIIILIIGLTGSAFNEQTQADIPPGESLQSGRWTVLCQTVSEDYQSSPNYARAVATVDLVRNGKLITTVYPERRFYYAGEQTSSEVAIHRTLREDVYVVLAGVTEEGLVALQVYRNPLVNWIWIGGIIMALGSLLCLMPTAQKNPVTAQSAARDQSGLKTENP